MSSVLTDLKDCYQKMELKTRKLIGVKNDYQILSYEINSYNFNVNLPEYIVTQIFICKKATVGKFHCIHYWNYTNIHTCECH